MDKTQEKPFSQVKINAVDFSNVDFEKYVDENISESLNYKYKTSVLTRGVAKMFLYCFEKSERQLLTLWLFRELSVVQIARVQHKAPATIWLNIRKIKLKLLRIGRFVEGCSVGKMKRFLNG